MRKPRVLFLAATEREMIPLRRLLAKRRPKLAMRLAVTGVGKAAAACETARELAAGTPGLVVQVGCAGAFRGARLSIGDVVLSSLEVLADEGVLTPKGFLDLEELGLAVIRIGRKHIFNRIPVHRLRETAWTRIAHFAAGRFAVRRGTTATVSTISGTNRKAKEVATRWDALSESMEGAAAALAAIAFGRRLLEVRGISNIAGDRDRASWKIDLACDHAAAIALRLVELELGLS